MSNSTGRDVNSVGSFRNDDDFTCNDCNDTMMISVNVLIVIWELPKYKQGFLYLWMLLCYIIKL